MCTFVRHIVVAFQSLSVKFINRWRKKPHTFLIDFSLAIGIIFVLTQLWDRAFPADNQHGQVEMQSSAWTSSPTSTPFLATSPPQTASDQAMIVAVDNNTLPQVVGQVGTVFVDTTINVDKIWISYGDEDYSSANSAFIDYENDRRWQIEWTPQHKGGTTAAVCAIGGDNKVSLDFEVDVIDGTDADWILQATYGQYDVTQKVKDLIVSGSGYGNETEFTITGDMYEQALGVSDFNIPNVADRILKIKFIKKDGTVQEVIKCQTDGMLDIYFDQ